MTTENLGELFAAMAAARLEFGEVVKNKTANLGKYTYSYAELKEVIDATAAALAKNGLILIQEPEVVTDNGQTSVVVSGCIGHKSGGVYSLKPLALPVADKTAQAVGSAISYARRYQLTSVLNLAAADDDGQAAQDAPTPKQKPVDVSFDKPKPQLATKAQLKQLGDLGVEFYKGEWAEQLPKLVLAVTKGATSDVSQLQPAECAKLIAGIQHKMAEAVPA